VSALYILLAVSLLVAVAFLAAFIWASRSGQFDDTHTPSLRVLGDDDVKTDRVEKNKRST
jgi:cbb3-type cytochrome oxidase maturation protein